MKTVDLFLFMGQSNMAGRGSATPEHSQEAPVLTEGAGYEYRAVSSPNRLYPISEPFGRLENKEHGIDDGTMKTGSLVTAFVNAYYEKMNIPIVGVSASKGGSRIDHWQPGGPLLNDAIDRLNAASEYLALNYYFVRHRFILWCQGESDGDIAKSGIQYQIEFEHMLNTMIQAGIEKCFLIQIGHYNGSGKQNYYDIMIAQDRIAQINKNVIIVSRAFAIMQSLGLMKDDFHYFQEAYNTVGREAGENTARYLKNILHSGNFQ